MVIVLFFVSVMVSARAHARGKGHEEGWLVAFGAIEAQQVTQKPKGHYATYLMAGGGYGFALGKEWILTPGFEVEVSPDRGHVAFSLGVGIGRHLGKWLGVEFIGLIKILPQHGGQYLTGGGPALTIALNKQHTLGLTLGLALLTDIHNPGHLFLESGMHFVWRP